MLGNQDDSALGAPSAAVSATDCPISSVIESVRRDAEAIVKRERAFRRLSGRWLSTNERTT